MKREMSERPNKVVYMKILVAVKANEKQVTPEWFKAILADIEECFDDQFEAKALLKGFDIEHIRR